MQVFSSRRARRGQAAAAQRGWSLLEGAATMALLGVLAATVLSVARLVAAQEDHAGSADDLARAEHAILGFALTHFRFPMPVDARPSPDRPGVVEGRFPATATGATSSGHLRYLVDESLTRAPASLYRPDPLGLAGDLIAPRQAANGLDLCVALLADHPPGKSAHGDTATVPAFGVRAAAPGEGGDENPTMTPPRDAGLRGHAESAAHLGCLEKLSGLAVAVKATAVAADLGRLAAQNVAFRTLLVANAEASVTNLRWQQANLAASLTRYALDATQHVVQLKSTPVALAKGAGTLVSIAAAMAATAISIDQNRAGLAAAQQSLPQARQRLAAAVRHEQAMQDLVGRQATRSNQLLRQG